MSSAVKTFFGSLTSFATHKHHSKKNLLPCPYDALEGAGYDFCKFASRGFRQNAILVGQSDQRSWSLLTQISKERNKKKKSPSSSSSISIKSHRTGTKPPFNWIGHCCGPMPVSYFALDHFWFLVTPNIRPESDAVSYLRNARLPPGPSREKLVQKWCSHLLPRMGSCHSRGLHHCSFDWSQVFLDGQFMPVWVGSHGQFYWTVSEVRLLESRACCQKTVPNSINPMFKPPETFTDPQLTCSDLDAIESWVFGAALLNLILDKHIFNRDFSLPWSGSFRGSRLEAQCVIKRNLDKLPNVLLNDGLTTECQSFLISLLKYRPGQRMLLRETSVHPWISCARNNHSLSGAKDGFVSSSLDMPGAGIQVTRHLGTSSSNPFVDITVPWPKQASSYCNESGEYQQHDTLGTVSSDVTRTNSSGIVEKHTSSMP